jgi:hypothetical protein
MKSYAKRASTATPTGRSTAATPRTADEPAADDDEGGAAATETSAPGPRDDAGSSPRP